MSIRPELAKLSPEKLSKAMGLISRARYDRPNPTITSRTSSMSPAARSAEMKRIAMVRWSRAKKANAA